MRELYYPFEEGLKAPGPDVYQHEMPGGQYTNLREQAASMGVSHRWPEIARLYAGVNLLFGDIVKVTPSSKVVGDMALFMQAAQDVQIAAVPVIPLGSVMFVDAAVMP